VKSSDFYPVPYRTLFDYDKFNSILEYVEVILEPTSGIGSIIQPIKNKHPNMKIYSNELSKDLL
tara:strand:- start:494 stop:685 length:192 start_codon:yes stop_codon:yes gene_type:complete